VRNQTKRLVGLFSFVVAGLLILPTSAFADFNFGKLVPNLNFVYGNTIDSLYNIIFWLVGIAFFATEGALILFLFLFRARPGHKAQYSHGNVFAELSWALIPAVILVWLAFYQKSTWAFIRYDMPKVEQSEKAQVFAEQFLWNFRYSGPDGKFGTGDDIMTINQLHVPVGRKFVQYTTAKDVIHSFFIPQARAKQDVVPGMLNRMWYEIDKVVCWDLKAQKEVYFTVDELKSKKMALEGFNLATQKIGIAGKRVYTYAPAGDKKKVAVLFEGKISDRPIEEVEYVQHPLEIACAQLCGLGHYKMVGYAVIDTPETYDRWMKQAVKEKLRSGEDKWAIWDKHFPQYNQVN
jgi:cytochrome c oxidase subunit II